MRLLILLVLFGGRSAAGEVMLPEPILPELPLSVALAQAEVVVRSFAPVIQLPLASDVLSTIIATFTPQTTRTYRDAFGSNPRDVSLVQVELCTGAAQFVLVHASRVYQAAQRKGLRTISPILVGSTLRQAERRGWVRLSLEGANLLLLAAAILTNAEVVQANTGVKAGLPIATQVVGYVASRLREQLPQTSGIERLILDGLIQLPPAGCHTGLILVGGTDKLDIIETEVR